MGLNLDKIIQTKYQGSLMNDTKWYKLLEALTNKFDDLFLNFKLVYGDELRGAFFIMPDAMPYFMEPTLYKEVEWIQFPCNYEWTYHKRVSRQITKAHTQDILAIEREIERVGVFACEKDEFGLRLYGYR